MAIKNLRVNKKYRYVKSGVAGGLVVGTIMCGALTFIHGVLTGKFQPIITKDTKQEVYGIDNEIHSKNGIENYKEYKSNLKYNDIVTFKYNNVQSVYDVSSLDAKRLKFICSNVKETDIDKIESLEYYVNRYSDEIDVNDINVNDYYSNNENGMKYITRTIDFQDSRMEPVFKNKDNILWLYSVVPTAMIGLFTGCGVLMGISTMQNKIVEEEKQLVKTLSDKNSE